MLQFMSAIDAISLRNFQDRMILGMAVVAGIVPALPVNTLFQQKIALNEFLNGGRQSFPTRMIDVICKCTVVIKQKAKYGQLTDDEEGLWILLGSDENVCEAYDFIFSESSWTRLSGNLKAHPPVEPYDELKNIVSRSVVAEEHPVATQCVAAFKCLYPDASVLNRVELASIARETQKVKGLRSRKVTNIRYKRIIECLNYYRGGKNGKDFATMKKPMF